MQDRGYLPPGQVIAGTWAWFYEARSDPEELASRILSVEPKEWKMTHPGDHRSLIHYVCQHDQLVEIAKLMLREFPDLVNLRDGQGWTCLHFAALHHQHEMICLFISKGANLNAKIFSDKKTPFELVQNIKSRKAFIANGARFDPKKHRRLLQEYYELEWYETHVKTRRGTAIAIMALKRRNSTTSKIDWSRFDRFLVRVIALAIWASRYDDGHLAHLNTKLRGRPHWYNWKTMPPFGKTK